jgi:hypothetical protein
MSRPRDAIQQLRIHRDRLQQLQRLGISPLLQVHSAQLQVRQLKGGIYLYALPVPLFGLLEVPLDRVGLPHGEVGLMVLGVEHYRLLAEFDGSVRVALGVVGHGQSAHQDIELGVDFKSLLEPADGHFSFILLQIAKGDSVVDPDKGRVLRIDLFQPLHLARNLLLYEFSHQGSVLVPSVDLQSESRPLGSLPIVVQVVAINSCDVLVCPVQTRVQVDGLPVRVFSPQEVMSLVEQIPQTKVQLVSPGLPLQHPQVPLLGFPCFFFERQAKR